MCVLLLCVLLLSVLLWVLLLCVQLLCVLTAVYTTAVCTTSVCTTAVYTTSMSVQLRYYDSIDDTSCKDVIDLKEVVSVTSIKSVQGAPRKAEENAFFEVFNKCSS